MRIDPIGDRYYTPLRRADGCLDWLFLAVAVLSILVLMVERESHPAAADVIQILFILGVLAHFVVGMLVRLYWAPRAEDRRREELLSNALGVNLTHERTEGYYNNSIASSVKRLAVTLLENSFFSKNVAGHMAVVERVKVGFYFLVWLVVVINRSSDLALVAVVAQVVFSEDLISKLLRLEWLRIRFEKLYGELYTLVQVTDNFESEDFKARTVALFGLYETGKAVGGVVMSSRIFFRLNRQLSEEWGQIKTAAWLD